MSVDDFACFLSRSGILNAGYRVSGFHGRINSVKTNANPSVIWDIMRKWVRL